MLNTLTLQVSQSWKQTVEQVNKELDQIVIYGEPNTDVETSFGLIHINPRGSISALSFNGIDIPNNDYDFFATQIYQPKLKRKNRIDLRKVIKENINNFIFYPINDGDEVRMAILKYSKYFYDNYPVDKITNVEYTFKSMLVTFTYDDGQSEIYYFRCDFQDEFNLYLEMMQNNMNATMKGNLYLCGVRKKEKGVAFLAAGTSKKSFAHLENIRMFANLHFFKTCILYFLIHLVRKFNLTDNEKERNILKYVMLLKYKNQKKFAQTFNLSLPSLKPYFESETYNILKESRVKLEKRELFNILQINEDLLSLLQSKNLLIEIDFDEIPYGESSNGNY